MARTAEMHTTPRPIPNKIRHCSLAIETIDPAVEAQLIEQKFIRVLAVAGLHSVHELFGDARTVLVGHVADLPEQQAQVLLGVPGRAAPPSGEDAGGAAQHVDADAGVVGDGGQPGVRGGGARLDQGVLGERCAVLDRLRAVVGQHLEAGQHRRKDSAQFLDLVGVVGGENDAHVSGPGWSSAVR